VRGRLRVFRSLALEDDEHAEVLVGREAMVGSRLHDSWQFNAGPIKPSLSVTVTAGTVLKFVNDDVMPQKLSQTAGPKLRLVRANMNHMSASMSVRLARKGLYRFTTKAGEDYKGMAMMKTIGEDHILHLSVHVK
jgi:hypothetical protein